MTSESDVRHSEVIQIENVSDKTKKDGFVLQQQYLYDRIANDARMDLHFNDVITSMLIVAATDESLAMGKLVAL